MSRRTARHRKDVPSVTGKMAKVGAASAATAAITTGSLVAVVPAAHAAPDKVWDDLAQCESSSRWNVNTGNGYYGGVQFSAATWRAAGGTKFAPRADLATREQQIEIADAWLGRVQKEQGVSQAWATQWPQCSKKLGIRDERAGSVQTTVATTATSSPGEYIVQGGDTLQKIATAQGIGSWRVLFTSNRDRVRDPNRIFVGQSLRLSGAVAAPVEATSAVASAVVQAPAAASSRVASEAQALVGARIPYVFGGKTLGPQGADCSGFVWRVLQRAGYDVPYRSSSALRAWGTVVTAAEAQPGDLVYWPGHIGIYVGNGQVVDQTSSNGGDPRQRNVWGSPTYLRISA